MTAVRPFFKIDFFLFLVLQRLNHFLLSLAANRVHICGGKWVKFDFPEAVRGVRVRGRGRRASADAKERRSAF